MVAPVATLEGEREALLEFKMDELRTIATDIGADGAKTKAQIVENILAKKTGEAAPILDEEAAAAEAEPQEEPAEILEDAIEQLAESTAIPATTIPLAEDPNLVKHLMLTMWTTSDPESGVLSQEAVNNRVNEYLALGYEPIEFEALGVSPVGHKMLWVFQKAENPRYERSMHIMRLITPTANPIRGTMSGFQADAYISAFLEAGWSLIGARYNGDDVLGEQVTGIYMLWMLVK